MTRTPLIETSKRTRIHKTEKRSFAWQIIKGVFRLCVLGALMGIVWYVTRLTFFTITAVEVYGGETISLGDVRSEVQNELMGTYVHVIPKRFTYLYPHDRIVEVVDANDRIHNVHVFRTSRTALQVTFEEYVPHALWCRENEESACFFMTREGYAYGEAPLLDGGALVRHTKEGENELLEGIAIVPETLSQIEMFMTRMHEELGFRVASVYYKKNGDITLALHGGGLVHLTRTSDIESIFNHLKAILASDEFSHIEPGNFQYIDVRFPGKAYVNETIPQHVSSTTEATTTTVTNPE